MEDNEAAMEINTSFHDLTQVIFQQLKSTVQRKLIRPHKLRTRFWFIVDAPDNIAIYKLKNFDYRSIQDSSLLFYCRCNYTEFSCSI